MDLLEYQAKALFQEMGIPILPSQQIAQPKDLKGLKIPYPVVLKSQVRRGGRGKAGGIRFVENTIDAVAAAQMIFNLPIMGEQPEVLLAEAKYDAEREFYLAVVLDSSARRPVLLGSQHGGMRVETAIEQMQQVSVDQEFSPFYARRLALKMGVQGVLIAAVSTVVEKMYRLFLQKDLDLVEINPLGINAKGEVMALDGKVTVNNSALERHPDLAALVTKNSHLTHHPTAFTDRATLIHQVSGLPALVEMEGEIGILCNGAGLTMMTLDLVHQAGGKPAGFLNIGGEYHHVWPPKTLQVRLKQGLNQIIQSPKVKVVLINLLSGVMTSDDLAQALREVLPRTLFSEGMDSLTPLPQFVVRLVGRDEMSETTRSALEHPDIWLTDNLDGAIADAVELAKGS